MHPILNIAIKAARRAGKTIVRNSYRVERIKFDEKEKRDYVTEIDRLAEQEIIDVVRNAYPQHSITAEEGSRFIGNEVEWIIDPLDGTTNYIHGLPQVAVSIAVMESNKLQHAVIYDPIIGDLFSASRGSGAHLNERRIRVSKTKRLSNCLIGTGFPFRENDNVEDWIAVFRELTKKTSGIRRPGSAAIDLAYVAAGKYDGFWESGLKPWDIAAGALIVQEAGGIIADFKGGTNYLNSGQVIAANPGIYDELLSIVSSNVQSIR